MAWEAWASIVVVVLVVGVLLRGLRDPAPRAAAQVEMAPWRRAWDAHLGTRTAALNG